MSVGRVAVVDDDLGGSMVRPEESWTLPPFVLLLLVVGCDMQWRDLSVVSTLLLSSTRQINCRAMIETMTAKKILFRRAHTNKRQSLKATRNPFL